MSSFVLLSTMRTTGTLVLESIAIENCLPGPADSLLFRVWTAVANALLAGRAALSTVGAAGDTGARMLEWIGVMAISFSLLRISAPVRKV